MWAKKEYVDALPKELVPKDNKPKGQVLHFVSINNLEFAKNVADKVLFIADGEVAEEGDPKELFENPKTEKLKAFLKKKNLEISLKRYGIDALGAMAQGLFCSLLIGTIIDTLGKQLGIGFLTETVATVSGKD